MTISQDLKIRRTQPWKDPGRPLVIDAYELNIIDWQKLLTDKRIAGFIHKASDGLPECFTCKGPHAGDTFAHSRARNRLPPCTFLRCNENRSRQMGEDEMAKDAVEHVEKPAKPGSNPPAGPHAKPHLTDKDKTPGTGSLPDPDAKDADAGPD